MQVRSLESFEDEVEDKRIEKDVQEARTTTRKQTCSFFLPFAYLLSTSNMKRRAIVNITDPKPNRQYPESKKSGRELQ